MSQHCIFCFFLLFIFYKVHLSQSSIITLWSHQLPINLNSFCVGLYNGEVTVFGGWTDSGSLQNSYTSTTIDNPWTLHDITPYPLNAASFSYVQRCVQIPDQPLLYSVPVKIRVTANEIYSGSHLLIYDLNAHSYINITTYQTLLPYPASYACIVLINNTNINQLYVIGGIDNDSTTARVQSYDISGDSWTQKASLNLNRDSFGCDTVPNTDNIYVFGGSTWNGTNDVNTDSIEKYSVSGDIWTEISAKLTVARKHVKCHYLLGRIFCVGGTSRDISNPYPQQIEVFNPYNERILNWNLMLNYGRYYSQSLVYNNTLLILGGRNETNRHNSIEVIYQNNFISTTNPTSEPTSNPTTAPTTDPTIGPTNDPTQDPPSKPSENPSKTPTINPAKYPTKYLTKQPTKSPTDGEEGSVDNIETTAERNDNGGNLSLQSDYDNFLPVLLLSIMGVLSLCICCILILLYQTRRRRNKAMINKAAEEIDIEICRVISVSAESPQIHTPITTNGQISGINTNGTITNEEAPKNDKMDGVHNDYGMNALSMWLCSIGLMQYFDLFIKEGFHEQMATLISLTDNDLEEMGIKKMAHRKRILLQIENNRNMIFNVQNGMVSAQNMSISTEAGNNVIGHGSYHNSYIGQIQNVEGPLSTENINIAEDDGDEEMYGNSTPIGIAMDGARNDENNDDEYEYEEEEDEDDDIDDNFYMKSNKPSKGGPPI